MTSRAQPSENTGRHFGTKGRQNWRGCVVIIHGGMSGISIGKKWIFIQRIVVGQLTRWCSIVQGWHFLLHSLHSVSAVVLFVWLKDYCLFVYLLACFFFVCLLFSLFAHHFYLLTLVFVFQIEMSSHCLLRWLLSLYYKVIVLSVFQTADSLRIQLHATWNYGSGLGFLCYSTFLVECLCWNDKICW